MKKLYRIIVLHGAPKDTHVSTETYLIAESDEQVYHWIDTNKANEDWAERAQEQNEDPDTFYYCNEAGDEQAFMDWVLENKGDIDDEAGWEDAYYGVTKWGWNEVQDASEDDMDVLEHLGIAQSALLGSKVELPKKSDIEWLPRVVCLKNIPQSKADGYMHRPLHDSNGRCVCYQVGKHTIGASS